MNSHEILYSSSIRIIDNYLEETKEHPVRSFFGARIRAVSPLIAGVVDLVATPIFLLISPITMALSSKINKSGRFSAYVITSRHQLTENLKRLYNLPVGIFLHVMYGMILNTSTNVRLQEALGLYSKKSENQPPKVAVAFATETKAMPMKPMELSSVSVKSEKVIERVIEKDVAQEPEIEVVDASDQQESESQLVENVPPSTTPLDEKLQLRNDNLIALKAEINKVKNKLNDEANLWKDGKNTTFTEEISNCIKLLQEALDESDLGKIKNCIKLVETFVTKQSAGLVAFSPYRKRMNLLNKEIKSIKLSIKKLIKLDQKIEQLQNEQAPSQEALVQ